MDTIYDVSTFIYQTETRVREALERFNVARLQIGCVADGAGRLIGTLTDGDIRRGMLSGVGLEDPVELCMNREPYVLREGERLGSGALRHDFVPIIDDDGRLIRLLIAKLSAQKHGPCLIMAGGFGSRMGDATRNIPKPLLELNGRPILDHILTRIENAGYTSVYISTYYLSEKIEEFVKSRQNEADIRIVREPRKLGTAGAISLLPEIGDAPLTVLNGDVVTNVDLRAFREYYDRHRLDATIAVARYDYEIPYGVVRQNSEGLFTGIDEKPKMRHFVSAGIYCLGPDIQLLVSQNNPMDMPELLNEARSLGLRVGLFPIHEYWRDVGRPTDLSSANKEWTDMSNGK